MTQILPQLYLGNAQDALGNFILNNGITAVVNVTKDINKSPYISNSNFLRIAIDDSPDENILIYVPIFMDFMRKHPQDIILIHCYAGISRSTSYVIIYLMLKYAMSFDSAYSYVRSLRPYVNINQG